MTNLTCAVGVAHEFWKDVGYMGEGSLTAAFKVGALPLLKWYIQNMGGENCIPGFYDGTGLVRPATPLKASCLSLADDPVPAWGRPEIAVAEIEIDFEGRESARSRAVAIATNQILRDLGYAVSLSELKSCL